MTAEVCETTNGKPAAVCSSPVVAQYEAALPLLNGHGGGCPISALSPTHWPTSSSRQRRWRRPPAATPEPAILHRVPALCSSCAATVPDGAKFSGERGAAVVPRSAAVPGP